MSTASHLAKLNGPQRRAVTYGEPVPGGGGQPKGFKSGPLLIVAGAGTGKTDTLAHRVAHLVINGVDPGAHHDADLHPPRGDGDAPSRLRARQVRARRDPGRRQPGHPAAHELGGHLPFRGQPPAAPLRPAPEASIRSSACSTAATPPTSWTACARSSDWRRRSSAFRARTPACRSTPTASTPSARSRRRSRGSSPGARSGSRTSRAFIAPTSSASSATACSTTTTCCSIGRS